MQGHNESDFRLPLIAGMRPWQRLALAYAVLAVSLLLWAVTIHGKSGVPNPVVMFLEAVAGMILFWVLVDLFKCEYGPQQVAMVTWVSIAVGSFLGQIGTSGLANSVTFAAVLGAFTYAVASGTLKRRARRLASLPSPPPSEG